MKVSKCFGSLAVSILVLVSVIFCSGTGYTEQPDKMMSKTDMDIIDTAVSAGEFNTLAAALKAADLITPLKGNGPFTVFAPTDSAFAKLPHGKLEELLKPENINQLRKILKHHVVNEEVLLKGDSLKTLNDDVLFVNDLGKLIVNDAMIISKNIKATNGVIHVIDTVLIPTKDEEYKAALKIISTAIGLGAPLYNSKDEEACALIYKSALGELMAFPGDVVNVDSKKKIADVFAKTSRMKEEGKKAWDFRHVLDDIEHQLQEQRKLVKGDDIVDIAVAAGGFDVLVSAIKKADLAETLKGDGPFTVFAPTDQAFGKLPTKTLEDLLKPENKNNLASILTYHVVPGKIKSSELSDSSQLKTVNGESLSIKKVYGAVIVDNAMIIKTDIEGSNGVIHVIDTVLLPQK
ncbi:MAG TPA: fasciclin domain-containing protein [Candidatus Omnitrophota bacterium]|nr:fasciclin domain-containing protein [Candidatus Omnitrophota bacterium]